MPKAIPWKSLETGLSSDLAFLTYILRSLVPELIAGKTGIAGN